MVEFRFGYCLVLLSGPPRAGKNRAGNCLKDWLGGDHIALSNQLKRMTHEYYGLYHRTRPLHFEDMKDLPHPYFGGLTPREAYIKFSEEVMKPRFGKGYLGEVGGRRVARNRAEGKVTIISGVGFSEEVAPLIEAAGVGNVLHIRVNPAGESSCRGKDSRKILNLTPQDVDMVELINHDCMQFTRDLQKALGRLSRNEIPEESKAQDA